MVTLRVLFGDEKLINIADDQVPNTFGLNHLRFHDQHQNVDYPPTLSIIDTIVTQSAIIGIAYHQSAWRVKLPNSLQTGIERAFGLGIILGTEHCLLAEPLAYGRVSLPARPSGVDTLLTLKILNGIARFIANHTIDLTNIISTIKQCLLISWVDGG